MFKITSVLLLLLLPFSVKSQKSIKVLKDSINIDSLLSYSKKFIGTNYKYASCGPESGFDCSGFVYYVFNHFNVKVPRSSSDFNTAGITVNPDSARVGDVIVFTGTNAKIRKPGHVGIVISNPQQELQFIHSSSNKKHSGVKISSYKESPYYKTRFLKIVRVTNVHR